MKSSIVVGALALIVALLAALPPARPVEANYHLSLVSEVMVGYEGDMDVQFIEVEMLLATQNQISGTRFSVWNEDGSDFTKIFLLDHDLENHGTGVPWLMATQAFVDLTDLEPDFLIPPVLLSPTGMFCWGGPDFAPPADQWDASFPFLYTDCVAYGDYAGGNSIHPPPTNLPAGDGTRALQRISIVTQPGTGEVAHLSAPPDLESFFLRCPTPSNNAGEVVLMGDDDDGDGLPNCHEDQIGTDPAVADTDGDGFSDREEYDAGSDATDAASTPFSNPTPTPDSLGEVFGDANGDTLINAIDAALVLQHSAGLLTLDIVERSDVDCSGQLSSVDALLILQFVGRLIAAPSQACPPIGSFV
jgi:hypothetical protein